MARVYIPSQTWSPVIFPDTENYQPKAGASVQIKNLDGTNATHYSAATAGSSSTGALTSNSDGTFPGRWIEEGDYDLVIDGGTAIRVPATSGHIVRVLASDPLNVDQDAFDAATHRQQLDGLFAAARDAAGVGGKFEIGDREYGRENFEVDGGPLGTDGRHGPVIVGDGRNATAWYGRKRSQVRSASTRSAAHA